MLNTVLYLNVRNHNKDTNIVERDDLRCTGNPNSPESGDCTVVMSINFTDFEDRFQIVNSFSNPLTFCENCFQKIEGNVNLLQALDYEKVRYYSIQIYGSNYGPWRLSEINETRINIKRKTTSNDRLRIQGIFAKSSISYKKNLNIFIIDENLVSTGEHKWRLA